MCPSAVALFGLSRKASWKALEVGEIRNVLDEGLDPRVERRLLASPPSASRRSIPRAISARALMMCATSLRVLLMLNWTSTLLRDVLVDLDVVLTREQPLELRAVVAGGAAEQRDPRGIEIELVVVGAPRSCRPSSSPGAPQSVKPDVRYSAGIISAGVAARKVLADQRVAC